MGVVDEFWWSVQWPWMLVWIVTAALLTGAVWILVAGYRHERARRRAEERPVTDICIYVHGSYVRVLPHDRDVDQALQQHVHVEERREINNRLGATFELPIFGGGADGGREENRVTVRSYVQETELVWVIRTIMDALDKQDAVVYADLQKGYFTRNQAVVRAVASARGQEVSDTLPLSRLTGFVWISGQFQKGEEVPGTTVFLVPYTKADHSSQADSHVQIDCVTGNLGDEARIDDSFPAGCFGKVVRWEAATRRLHILPIAIFQ